MTTSKLFSAIMVICSLSLISCVKEPEAIAGVSTQEAEIDQKIEFASYSTNASSTSWDLGDGTIEDGVVEFSHEYEDAGLYTVILIVETEDGSKSDKLEFPIYISNPIDKFIDTYVSTEEWESGNCGSGSEDFTMTIVPGNSPYVFYIVNFAGEFDSIQATVGSSNRYSFQLNEYNNLKDRSGHMWDIAESEEGSLRSNGLFIDYKRSDTYTPQSSQGQCGLVVCEIVSPL
jgi:PKD repeat protein